MSGGHFNYGYYHINDYAYECDDPMIRQLLEDVVTLCHDLEWYKSGDTGKDDWEESKSKFKSKWFSTLPTNIVRQTLLEYCNKMDKFCNDLKSVLEQEDK